MIAPVAIASSKTAWLLVSGAERFDTGRVAISATELVHEAHVVDACGVFRVVVRSSDETVQ
jgi:hypothetical protein